MVKKLLTIAFGLTLTFGVLAQKSNNDGHDLPLQRKTVTFPASDVQYWVGTGSNSAVVIIGWDDNPNGNFALVWGVHWNGSATAANMLDTIATYDERTSYPGISAGWMNGFHYNDGTLISGSTASYWCYTINGGYAGAYGSQSMADGDVMEISSSCMFTLTTATAATDPNGGASCPRAQSVSVANITTTSVDVTVNDTANVNNYTLRLLSGNTVVDSVVIFTQSHTFSGLTANTSYKVTLVSNCSDGTQTNELNATFRTPCVTYAHADLPWSEDFQSGTGSTYSTAAAFFSNHIFCWNLINPYSASDPYINSSSSVNPTGGQCLYVSSRPASPTILVLPLFEDTPDQLQLSFDVLSTYRYGFEAGVIDMTDSTFTPVATCLPDGNGWTHFDVTFAGISSGRLALRSNDNGPAYLDNVVVEELPSCVKPSQVLVSNVTASSATLTITDPNNSNHYKIYVAEDSVEIFSNTYTLSDLLPNTRYVVNVKTLCSDTTTGMTETAFRTSCGPIAIPYHEDFSQFVDVANGYGYAVTDSTLPCWGFLKGRSLDRLELFTPSQSSTYSYGEDGLTMRIYGNNSDSRDLVVLPELEQEINTLEMSFVARPSETGSFGGTLQVGYLTDADDSSTFVAVGNYPCAQFANGYDLCVNTFLDAPTDARIALRYLPSGGSAKSWYIDEIDVHDMPACVRVQGISVDSIGTNGFTLHVADPTLVNHYRYYLTSEAGVDSADFYDTVTIVSDVAASTDYQLQVVSICDDGTLTLPLTISLSTLCAPVTEVPFVENFEDWTATAAAGMNRCWNRLYNNSSSTLVTNNYPYCASGSGNALNGIKSLKMYSKGASSAIKEYSVAYLPEFEANVTGLKVRFFYKYGGTTTNINKVKVAVGISNNVVDTTTFTRLATLTPTEIGWNEFEVELSGYTGTGNRITIMQTSTSTTAFTSYIDSLVVDTISSCDRPATVTVDNATAYGADLTWTDPSEAGTYIVRWSDGITVDSAIVTGETSYTLTNLVPSTNYSVDIRSICWGTPTNARATSFATSCAPMSLPWEMNFDNITNMNQLSSCWNRYSGLYVDSTNSAVLTSTTSGWTRSTTAFDNSSHVKVNLYGTSCKYWLVTPELNLTEDAELSFDYMLTKYNNTNVPETGSGLEDDRLVVLVTTNNSVWTPLAQWGSDTERDDYALASVTNTVSHAHISLSAFTGQVVRLAFYGESTVAGTDNDFRIDNLMVAAPDTTTEPPADTIDATIAFRDILYWVGTGTDSAAFIVNYGVPDTAFAWGYLFNGSTTAEAMVDAIAAADPRFEVVGTPSNGGDLRFVLDNGDTLSLSPVDPAVGYNFWWTNLNGVSAGAGAATTLHNGDVFKYGDLNSATPWDFQYGYYMEEAWTKQPTPVSIPVSDTTIIDDSIRYWVGIGEGSAIVEIAWEEDGMSLAWGVHFDEDYYPSTIDLLDSIDTYDPRFDYQVSYYMSTPYNISSISFTEGELSLSQTNTSNIVVRRLTSLGDIDPISGDELEDYSIWNGDTVQISTSGLYDFSEVIPVNPPTINPEQPIDTLCSTVHNLPYEMDFSGYTTDQSMRVYYASAPQPECWTVLGNGRFTANYDTTATANTWFGGVGFSTSTNNYGCVTVNDPYYGFIAYGHYDGTYATYVANEKNYGTKRFAILPPFDHPLNQTVLTFDHRTSARTGAALLVGYIVSDTADFVAIDSIATDFRVLHHDTVDFTAYASIPADARLTLLWKSTDTTHMNDSPANYYCGIDNLKVELDTTPDIPEPPTPVDALIDFADILYWVGTGSDSAALIVNFGIPDTAFAWGYRFNGSATVQQMTDAITAADPRFTAIGQPSLYPEGDIFFVLDNGDTLSLSGRDADNPWNYWEANINGEVSYTGAGQTLTNGDVFKYGDQRAPTRVCLEEMSYGETTYCLHAAWTKVPTPVSVPDTASTPIDTTVTPVDATIAASDILFWVGEGSNEVVLAVNWADTALAWGYRFATDSVSTATMMADIAAVDPRFSYSGSSSLYDIYYIDTAAGMTDTLAGTPSEWWSSLLNGYTDAGMAQMLVNGDFKKWTDPTAGVVVDSIFWVDYNYTEYVKVYPMTIYPVTVPDTTTHDTIPVDPQPEHGPFCGAVGTEGCTAIAVDSSAIVAWATDVVINRGPQKITNPDGPLASFGSESNAIGMATASNTMAAVSLGDGGTALVTFAHPIRNGEGPDFAVFENSFGDFNLELAFVEVSSDGERFVRFPATSLTQSETQTDNFGTTDPTNLNNLAGKFRIGYGTPFDLEELADSTGIDLDSIVYVRVVDVVGCIDPQYGTYDAYGHIINEPWPTPFNSSGFDLTGVAVMYERIDSTVVVVPEDATIDQDSIVFWTGNGSNRAVIAVNWAAPDTCLAWGVKWNGAATVKDLMDTIMAYDPRFTYSDSNSMLSDIVYTVDDLTLRLTEESASPWGNYWLYNINGSQAQTMFNIQEVANGDFIKWGDPNSGTSIGTDEWNNDILVWTTVVTPVTEPTIIGIADVADVIESLWPNPTVDRVNVSVSRPVEAVLYDLSGRRLAVFSLVEGNNILDLTSFAGGVYMLRVEGSVSKIVKR